MGFERTKQTMLKIELTGRLGENLNAIEVVTRALDSGDLEFELSRVLDRLNFDRKQLEGRINRCDTLIKKREVN